MIVWYQHIGAAECERMTPTIMSHGLLRQIHLHLMKIRLEGHRLWGQANHGIAARPTVVGHVMT
jgi:hypothetical protein